VTALGRPDVVLQPGHQGKIVGEPAHQRHRRVGVQVDHSGHQRVIGQPDASRGFVAALGFRSRAHRDDAAAGHGHAVIGQNRGRRLDRDDPAGADEKIDSYRAGPLIDTIARRLGARQAISALWSLVSGQNFAGTVLPMPIVSTLLRSTPFSTT
jgi:hypothetical protein